MVSRTAGPETLGTGELAEIEIERLTGSGDGIGRLPSGRLVFVPRTAPGDKVEVRVTEDRARWARARLERILEPAVDRVTPPCPYFDRCGGCRTQHIAEPVRLAALATGVEDAFRRIGGLDVPVEAIEPAPETLGYRNRVTFTVRRGGGRATAGYHRLEGPRLLDVDACPLAEPAIGAVWRSLRDAWGPGGRYLPGSKGREIRVTLRATQIGEVGLFIEGGETPGAAERLMDGPEPPAAIWWRPTRGERRRLAGPDTLEERWGGERIELWPEAFLQVNRRVSEMIERHLDEGLGRLEGRRVVDLYAGIGLRALGWARRGADAVAVDAEPDAVRSGRALLEGSGVDVELVEASAEAWLAEGGGADIVVVNPPRAGLGPDVCDRIAGLSAERLVYVSCDPATLARDAARLAAGWAPVRARPFDAFPLTGHVETVLWLEPAAGRSGADA